jgi:hypothetical protein
VIQSAPEKHLNIHPKPLLLLKIRRFLARNKNILILAATIFILVAIPITTFVTLNSRDNLSQAAPEMNEKEVIRSLSLQLLKEAKEGKIPARELTNIARERKQKLVVLAEKDPQEALRNFYSKEIKASLPTSIQADLESEVSVEGEVEVSHSDEFASAESKFYFDLTQTDGKKLALHFGKREPRIGSGTLVRVTGTKIGDKVVVEDGQSIGFEVLRQADVLPAATVKKIAIIMFNFQNDSRQPFTATTVRNVLFNDSNSVNRYHKEVSFNIVSYTGHIYVDADVFGWYTIPFNNSPCENTSNNDWRPSARSAATPDGFVQGNYTNIIYAFPQTSACSYAGKANINGPSSWINGSFSSGVVAHELGHNFGASHASTYRCTEDGVNVPISPTCTANEYGDPFDVMGSSSGRKHKNNFNKGRVGWYEPGNTQTVTTSGTYNVFPIEKINSGVQALRIPTEYVSGSPSKYYYVEFRQSFGFDNFAVTDPVVNGVSIRIAPNYTLYQNTLLIDTTPTTTSFSDAALLLNQTFTDSAKGISIKTKSITAEKATVEVTLPGATCTRASPTLTISPTTAWTTPTGSLNYSVSVKNNDNSLCSASIFNARLANQVGLSQNPGILNLTIAPGATVSSNVNIFPEAGTIPEGMYTFGEQVTNSAAPTFSGSATANYNVANTTTKQGDINNDGSVNSADLAILISTWGSQQDLRADLNGDRNITSSDLAILISRWGS